MSDWLMHYGVMGMKWGVRRYQSYGEGGYNPNGIVPRKRTAPRNSMSEDPTSRPSRGRRGVITENPNSGLSRRSLKEMKYYKRNGELTRAGRKRREALDYASSYAKRHAKQSRESADEFVKDSKDYEKNFRERYTTKGGNTRYLDDMLGNDWHDKQYMKDVFSVDDVHKWAKEAINSDLEGIKKERTEQYNNYMNTAKKWSSESKYLSSVKVSDISRKQFKAAKKLAKLDKKQQKGR